MYTSFDVPTPSQYKYISFPIIFTLITHIWVERIGAVVTRPKHNHFSIFFPLTIAKPWKKIIPIIIIPFIKYCEWIDCSEPLEFAQFQPWRLKGATEFCWGIQEARLKKGLNQGCQFRVIDNTRLVGFFCLSYPATILSSWSFGGLAVKRFLHQVPQFSFLITHLVLS